MSHPSHPEDTLFIVVEPDFRFYAKEAESQRSEYEREAAAGCRYDDWLALKDALPKEHQAAFQRDFGRWATAQAEDQNAPWPMDAESFPSESAKAEETGAWHPGSWEKELVDWGAQCTVVYSRPHQAPVSAHRPESVSEELVDLCALFCAAARAGKGGLLWAGWSASQWGAGGKKVRKMSPSSGAHLVLVTTECARKLLPKALKLQDTHMGYFLGDRCGLDWQDYLGSAYLWPPVGGFWTHISTTCSSPDQPVELNHHFNHGWTQEGTRRREAGHVHRRICRFTREGPAVFYGNPVRLPEQLEALVWRTEPPPGTPDESCGLRYYHYGVSVTNKPQGEDRSCFVCCLRL